MSFLVVKLDRKLNILEAVEFSTHGLATQKAHDLIDAGFCARIVDKPVDPVKWFQELKQVPLMLEEPLRQKHSELSGPLDLRESGLVVQPGDICAPLTPRVRLVSHRTPVKTISSREIQIPPEKRRVIIRHG